MNYPKGGIVAAEKKQVEKAMQKVTAQQVKERRIDEKNAQIVIVASYGVFIELAEMIKHSLLELGLRSVVIRDSADVKLLPGRPDGQFDFSFVIRAFRPYQTWLLSGYKILFQTEECWNDRERGTYRYELNFDSDRILEMYDENCKLRDTGKVHYCPVGYSPIWERDMPKVEEDIDVLFHGSVTTRREKFLKELSKDYKVKIVSDVFGEERDALINRSKITLNIKARNLWSFGPLHCLPAMANEKFMLAEKANGGYGPFKPQRHFKEYNGLGGEFGLLEAVKYWINAGREARDEFAAAANADMVKTCDFTEILNNAMGDLL